MNMLKLSLEEGTWVAVLSDGHGNYGYATTKGFATKDQAETYLRKNHKQEYNERNAFPFDMKILMTDENKIGTFPSVAEGMAVINRIVDAPKSRN